MQIIKAYVSATDEKSILKTLDRKLAYVSKRIGFFFEVQNANPVRLKLTISSKGYSKLFPKIEALVEHAPKLELWLFEALVKPHSDINKFKLGLDYNITYKGVPLKISKLYFSIEEVNYIRKELKIRVYLYNYDDCSDNPYVFEAIELCILDIIGEIYYRKNIAAFQVAQLPQNPKKLIPFYELLENVEYIRNINKRTNKTI